MKNKLIPDIIAVLILLFAFLIFIVTHSILLSVGITAAILIVIIIIVAIKLNKQKKDDAYAKKEVEKIKQAISTLDDESVYKTAYSGYIQNNNQAIAKAIAELEPSFDVNEFTLWAQGIFNIVRGKHDSIKDIATPELYNAIKLDKINILNEGTSSIKTAYLNHYFRDSHKEELIVCVICEDISIKYILKFTRILHCSACNSELPLTTIGTCPSCGAVLTKNTDNWRLCDISLLTFNTIIDNRPFEILK